MVEADGWNYSGVPEAGTDARKIVTLKEGGMWWVGIRAYNHQGSYWMNNGEPEKATVHAWRDLPDIASGFWLDGKLHVNEHGWPKPMDSIRERRNEDQGSEVP